MIASHGVVTCVIEMRNIPSVDYEASVPGLHLHRRRRTASLRFFLEITLAPGPMQTQLIPDIRCEATIHWRRIVVSPLKRKWPSTQQ